MADGHTGDEGDIPAGDFSAWLTQMQRALRGERGSDVPCDGCTACCTSSQFIHIDPDETDTLARIPAELVFPAPRLPRGHAVLGYDEHGSCPMLIDNACSIYEHRPRACRTYDCRIFPASGIDVGDEDAGGDDGKVLIARRARRWQFSHPTQADRDEHDAVRAAATFLRHDTDPLSGAANPTNATQRAVRAIELHETFLRHDEQQDPREVRVDLMRRMTERDTT